MMLSLIAAKSINGVLGLKGQMPWCFSEDFKRFKRITSGGILIVGRKTFESILVETSGALLPGRDIIVLSKNKKSFNYKSVMSASNLDHALSMAKESNRPAFIAGGAALYLESLPMISTVYLTIINKVYEGDVFFPKIKWNDFLIDSSEIVVEKDVRLLFIKAARK
jgi:dihydrofolate reductase